MVPTNAAYTGHWLHERSGLELALYRAYDPELGRWLNEDPLEEEGGLNLYGYVENGPVMGIDPLGLFDPLLTMRKWLNKFTPNQIRGMYAAARMICDGGGAASSGKLEGTKQTGSPQVTVKATKPTGGGMNTKNGFSTRGRGGFVAAGALARANLVASAAVAGYTAGSHLGDDLYDNHLDKPVVEGDCESPTWSALTGKYLLENYPWLE